MAKLFFSYSHVDESLRDALEVHLSMLKRQGLIETVHDRRIVAGEDLDQAIDAYLESADVILCLLSPEFIASEYCFSREMARALERHAAGEAHVIPVILRHCEWQQTPLAQLRGTPRDNKPVKAWADQDEALNDVAADIRRAVEARSPKTAPIASPLATPPVGSVDAVLRPRSANLQVPRRITDKDRDDFLESAFEFVAEHFANSLDELKKRHPDLDGKLTRLDAHRFTAAAYRDGAKVSAITVFTGGGFGGRGISFNNSDRGEVSQSNGNFDLPSRGDELAFRSLFGISSRQESLDLEAVAETIWASFIAPLQR